MMTVILFFGSSPGRYPQVLLSRSI